MDKVKIELSPHDALTILSFCREFVNDDLADDPMYTSLKASVAEYEDEVIANITDSQIDDAKAEVEVNKLLGKCPDNYRPEA